METQKSFYMTLPSNVKSTDQHENLISHYTTYLPKTLNVRNYEVALSEICYPHSFDNIYEPINKVTFSKNIDIMNWSHKTKRIPPGYYKTMEKVAEAINKIKPKSFKGEIGFEKLGRQRAKIVLFDNEAMELHPVLAQLLGFDESRWEGPERLPELIPEDSERFVPELIPEESEDSRWRHKAARQGNMNSLYYNMFVYSSICANSIVGNQYYPLLRTVNVEGEEGDYIHKTFENGHYVKLASDSLTRIDIRITNDQGELVKFTYGKVIVKLHFRKIALFS